MNHPCLILTLAAWLGLAASAAAYGATLALSDLWCEAATDRGDDHLYVIVTAKKSDGTVLTRRLPKDPGYWEMNGARKDKQQIANVTLWSGPLNDSETVDISVYGMEEDGGLPGGWSVLATRAAELIRAHGSTEIGSALNVVTFLDNPTGIKDVDDLLGVFHVRLQNRKGRIAATWRVGERSQDKGFLDGEAVKRIWLKGEGGEYHAYLKVSP